MGYQFALKAATAVALGMIVTTTPGIAETKIWSSVESRVLLGFKVDDAAAQAWLPDGWMLLTLPRGPLAGANVLISAADQHMMLDAEGKPQTPSAARFAALVSYARKDGVEGVRTFITRVYESAPVVDPFENSVLATFKRTASTTSEEGQPVTRSEAWMIAPEGGGEISFDLSYSVGHRAWAPGSESLPYSSVNPDFHHIYRYDQMVELAMNAASGMELAGSVTYSVTVPELAPMFDGNEQLVAIMGVPVYVRDVYQP